MTATWATFASILLSATFLIGGGLVDAALAETWICTQANGGKPYTVEYLVAEDRLIRKQGDFVYRMIENSKSIILAGNSHASIATWRTVDGKVVEISAPASSYVLINKASGEYTTFDDIVAVATQGGFGAQPSGTTGGRCEQ